MLKLDKSLRYLFYKEFLILFLRNLEEYSDGENNLDLDYIEWLKEQFRKKCLSTFWGRVFGQGSECGRFRSSRAKELSELKDQDALLEALESDDFDEWFQLRYTKQLPSWGQMASRWLGRQLRNFRSVETFEAPGFEEVPEIQRKHENYPGSGDPSFPTFQIWHQTGWPKLEALLPKEIPIPEEMDDVRELFTGLLEINPSPEAILDWVARVSEAKKPNQHGPSYHDVHNSDDIPENTNRDDSPSDEIEYDSLEEWPEDFADQMETISNIAGSSTVKYDRTNGFTYKISLTPHHNSILIRTINGLRKAEKIEFTDEAGNSLNVMVEPMEIVARLPDGRLIARQRFVDGIPGNDLRLHHFRTGQNPIAQFLRMREVFGLIYEQAHQSGVRDVEPRNIIVTWEGQFVIIDALEPFDPSFN